MERKCYGLRDGQCSGEMPQSCSSTTHKDLTSEEGLPKSREGGNLKSSIDHWGKTRSLSWDGTVTCQIVPSLSVTALVIRLPLGQWASHSSWPRDMYKKALKWRGVLTVDASSLKPPFLHLP